MLRARWRQDNPESSMLLVGARPFGEVSTRRGKPGFHASLLLPTGLQQRTFAQREAAMQFLVDGVENYVLLQLTPATRTVALRLSENPRRQCVTRFALPLALWRRQVASVARPVSGELSSWRQASSVGSDEATVAPKHLNQSQQRVPQTQAILIERGEAGVLPSEIANAIGTIPSDTTQDLANLQFCGFARTINGG